MKGTPFWIVMAAVALVIWLVLRNYVGGIAETIKDSALPIEDVFVQT